jgi:hypothetical protein
MMNLPTIVRKAPKASYKKPDSVKALERMADAEDRRKHPTLPFPVPCKFRDDSANSLTKCIVEYIRLSGGFASRVSVQGTFSRKLNKYIPSTSRKGLADVMATYRGFSISCEVKIGRDKQSEAQMKVQDEVTRSGGLYYIAKDFSSFKLWFDNIINN